MLHKSKILIFLYIIFCYLTAFAETQNRIIVGKEYEIAEDDLLLLMKRKAEQVDWAKIMDKKKMEAKIKNFIPPYKCESKPRAKKERVRMIDTTSQLDMDIKDINGNVIYPAGYKINPLEYISLPNILVFIDGSDPAQLKWLMQSKYKDDYKSIIMLTDGGYYKIAQKLKRPVYYAPKVLADRLKIEYVPSVAVQKGRLMKVTEVKIDED